MADSLWDRPGVAQEIDTYWHTAGEAAVKRQVMQDLAKQLVIGDVLEVGCGSGLVYEAMLNAGLLEGRKYRGGDTSLEMLRLATSRHPDVSFTYMDLLSLGKVKEDNVLCIHVLQHLKDYRPAVAELLRTTKALLYIQTWWADLDVVQINKQSGFYDNFVGRGQIIEVVRKHRPKAQISWTPIGALVVRP